MKENSSLRNFLNSESTAYFLDETFYHTYTYTTSSIIHMTATFQLFFNFFETKEKTK